MEDVQTHHLGTIPNYVRHRFILARIKKVTFLRARPKFTQNLGALEVLFHQGAFCTAWKFSQLLFELTVLKQAKKT